MKPTAHRNKFLIYRIKSNLTDKKFVFDYPCFYQLDSIVEASEGYLQCFHRFNYTNK